MSLSCEDDYYPEPGDIFWEWPSGLIPMPRKRATKCCSCGKRIEPQELSARFHRWKVPESEIEVRIYGEDYENYGPPRASRYHCQDCANILFFLQDFHYSIHIEDDMRELAKEHAEMAGAGRAGCL